MSPPTTVPGGSRGPHPSVSAIPTSFGRNTTGGTMGLDQDFAEFIAFCLARDVRFLIVGGYALAAHGHPRFTKDLDVWVWAEPGNASRLIDALGDCGFGSVGLTEQDVTATDSAVQLGHAPKRTDPLTGIDGVEFDTCWSRRVLIATDELAIPFISVEDLIANKRASGRP